MAEAGRRPGRPLALAALLLLCGAKAPPTSRLPDWLVGAWQLTDVRESSGIVYPDGGGPVNWYHPGDTMTVTPDRLTFVMDACEVGTVKEKQGPISEPVLHIAGAYPSDLGLPPERKPLNYFAIKCARSLIASASGDGPMDDRGIKLTWYVFRRSPTEIDMPFLGGSYLKFRKTGPTS